MTGYMLDERGFLVPATAIEEAVAPPATADAVAMPEPEPGYFEAGSWNASLLQDAPGTAVLLGTADGAGSPEGVDANDGAGSTTAASTTVVTVSYTHLTLPTICSV